MAEQIKNTNTEINVDEYHFEKLPPIKGYPELRWRGKIPFAYTRFFPAQLKETYGKPDENGWMNKIFWGDNLQVMSHLLKHYREKIDLIYIDPPFDSKADYKKTIKLRGKQVSNDHTAFEEKQYGDMWNNDEYLQFMYERLILIRELLSVNGSLYIHLDEKRSHSIKLILDEVFGPEHFRREIIWDITVLSGFKVSAQNWIRGHDVIFYYSKSSTPIFNKLRQPHSQDYIDMFNRVDENGEKYMVAHGMTRYLKDVINKGKPFGDVWDDLLSYQIFRKKLQDARSIEDVNKLLDSSKEVQNISDVWDNIMSFQQQPTAAENCGYPTQKPETLLERIIKASSNPGDLVFDCFMGSGTTQSVALKLGRRFIGADINLGAIDTTVNRLNQILKNDPTKPGFNVYNVNNYDVFRNPEEAKDILIDALEITRIAKGTVFDGEKDGFMVKVMPVNRIANIEDLNEIINGVDQASLEKARETNPNKPVMSIRLICMGHEPDLGAKLVAEFKKQGFDVEVEVYDILRKDKELEFKHPAEALIEKDGNKLVIKEFFPMNLLQKLSVQKENVGNWKELVESVKIDWNYDGVVFQPTIVDCPENKKDLVAGSYDIPDDAGIIRVKITDLLSESFEKEFNWGK